ncbi:MAG: homoserine dehydrogenase, partial [Acidimicrobiaceae bacterium]|nr:homoserine dehydrogenase [Acidimicrobiaceae bacterium]
MRVGVLGCGNVGGALAQLLLGDSDNIYARTGIRLELAAVAVHSRARERSVSRPPRVLTPDAHAVVDDPNLDVVVEVIGGIEPARGLILAALKGGKPVITANKELLANVGSELFEAASAGGVDLLFEAAVAGGIPLIRPLRESLAGERIGRIMGIVNGTTNFVLTKMTDAGASYHDALAEAQRLGYAERDPTADVEGYDAAAKAAILATVAFGVNVVAGDVYREGISGVTTDDIAFAGRLGYVIKLLAIIEKAEDDQVAVRVHPAMVPVNHPLAAVRDSFNAVFVEGDAVGELMFLGRGAGGMPTASAVLGDLLDAAHNLSSGGAGRTITRRPAKIFPIDELRSEYYLSVDVADRPGVLHAVAGVLGRHNVSIRLMEQVGLGA